MTNIEKIVLLRPRLNAVQMQILLAVDLHEGRSMSEIAEDCGLPKKTVQFHLKTMTIEGKKGRRNAAMGLVFLMDDLMDKRKKEVYLTKPGHQVANLLQKMGDSCE